MTTDDAPRPALDAGEIKELAALLPTPCPVCGGPREYSIQHGGIVCRVPVPAEDDDAGQNAAARHWLKAHEYRDLQPVLRALPDLLAAAARAQAAEAEAAVLRHRLSMIREEAERLIDLGREHPANAGGYATNILWHCRRVVLESQEGDGNRE